MSSTEGTTTVVETPRLRLREFTEADLDVLAAMVADAEQMRFYPRTRTRDESEQWINRNLALYAGHGFGFWVIEEVHRGDFLGYAGIRPLTIDGVEEIEMGWHTMKYVWNQGIATHAAIACRDLALYRFDILRLVATIDPAHTASLRVAHKVGMQLEKQAVLDGWPCLVYSVDQSRPLPNPPHRMAAGLTER
jgi:RimJ/RimL family protein N-acetyltransferase